MAQRLARRPGFGARRRRSLADQEAEDLGDQGGVGGDVPGVALEQARRGVQQEQRERGVRFGEVERAFQGMPGGGRVAERVPGDRLKQESASQPNPWEYRGSAVKD